MKKYDTPTEALAAFIIYVFLLVCWGINLSHLFTRCDFDTPLRCEATYGIGLHPIASVVTVWIDNGDY